MAICAALSPRSAARTASHRAPSAWSQTASSPARTTAVRRLRAMASGPEYPSRLAAELSLEGSRYCRPALETF